MGKHVACCMVHATRGTLYVCGRVLPIVGCVLHVVGCTLHGGMLRAARCMVRAVQVLWSCDPMHGNTEMSSSGVRAHPLRSAARCAAAVPQRAYHQ